MPLDPKTADLMLSDWEGWEKTLNDGQRQEVESMLRFEPDREAAKKRFAGVAYVAASTGADVEEVSRRFEDWYLPAFTIDETVGLGRKEPVKDAAQFFDLLKNRASNNRARLDTLLSAQEAAFRSALGNGDDLADFSAWQTTQDHEEAWQGKAREAWQAARSDTLERLGQDGRGLAARVVRSLRHEMGVAVEPDAWINQTRDMLAELKARDADKYELVLAAAKAFNEKQQPQDKGVGQGVAESFGRGVADVVSGLPRALVDMSADASAGVVRAGITNAENPEALAARIEAGRDVDIDLRNLARGVIDPVKSKRDGWAKYAEGALYLGAGSAPTMFGAMLPGGQAALAGMFTDEAYTDLRQAGFTGAAAAGLAVTSGVLQGLTEGASEWVAGMPSVARWLAKWGAKPGSSWAGQFLARSGVRAGVEFTEELVQQVTTPALQELGAALTEAVPDRPEGQKLRDVVGQFFDKENAIPLALSVLPLGMIGAAASTGRDLAVIDAVMKNPRYLRAVMSEEKARAVMEEKDAAKRAEMIREGWEATPTPVIVERVQAIQQEERKEAVETLRVIQEAERAGMIPTIRRDAQGWSVEKSGALVRVSTREDAVRMAYASLADMDRQAAEATAQLADEFMSLGGGRAEAFEISRENANAETLADRGVLTPEQVSAGVETYAQLHGLTKEEAAAEAGRVLGFNRMEQVEGVRAAVSRIYGGGNVLTAIEEGVHGRWNAGLESGHYTHAMGITWVRMAEQASGFQFLPSRDDAAITPQVLNEAIAAVVQADVLGRRKDGKQHFTPGLVSRGVASFALAGRADAKQAGALATFLKAWREFWGQVLRAGRAMRKARAEGKLGDDFDVLLDDLLGTEPQQRHEAQAAREAADMVAEIDPANVPFSLAPMPAPLPADEGGQTAVTPAQDAEYMAAVEAGDTAKAQSVVDEVAKDAGISVSRLHLIRDIANSPKDERYKVIKPDSIRADDVISIFEENQISISPMREVIGAFVVDSKTVGGVVGSYEDDMTFDIAVSPEYQGRGIGGAMLRSIVRFFVKNHRRLAEKSDISPEDYNLWAVPTTERVKAMNASVGFNESNEIEGYELSFIETVTYDESGNVIPLSQRFNPASPSILRNPDSTAFSLAPRSLAAVAVTPAQDAEYMAAVEAGDTRKAQRMVDEAAKAAGYRIMWHGSTSGKIPKHPFSFRELFFGSQSKSIAENYASNGAIIKVFFPPSKKQLISNSPSDILTVLPQELRKRHKNSRFSYEVLREPGSDVYEDIDVIEYLRDELGYDSIVIHDDTFGTSLIQHSSEAWLTTENIESADPVTYDDQGNVIPLSQRFNPDSTAFALAPRSLAEVADTVLAAQMRKPEFREKYLTVARERLDKLRQDGEWRVDKWGNASRRTGTDTQAERIRTPANIEAERKFRQRSRQRELIEAGMMSLTPETLAAYEQGLTTIEDVPLVKEMLSRGKLMSKSAAEQAGKLKTDGKGNAGDYDGAPWMPPKWFARSGGYMPDRIAQELYEAGLLREPTPDAFWEALGRAIGSARAQNESVRKAQAAVRGIEKQALEQSRAEAEAWAKEERAKVPSAKDRQMAALRTLDVILSAFPPEIRGRVGGFVKLASLGTDAAREAEIVRRLDKLDEVVEEAARKHYREAIDKVFDRSKLKKGKPGEKPKGNLGPEAQALIDLARQFADLTETEVAAERAAIEKRMETAEGVELIDLLEREQVLELIGALDERTSAEMEAASEWLLDIYQTGRNKWRAVVEARETWVQENREKARRDIGKQGLDSEQQHALKQAKTVTAAIKGTALSWLSFEQVMQSILGRKSSMTKDVVRQARAATNAKTDAMRSKRAEFRRAMAGIFGTTRQREWQDRLWQMSQIGGVKVMKIEGARIEARQVAAEAVKRIIEGKATAKAFGLDTLTMDKLADAWADNEALPANRRKKNLDFDVPVAGTPTPTELSEFQAVHLSMMARQASYTELMAGHGWTADVMKDIEAQLSPEAKAVREWLAGQYRDGYKPLNAVYSRMYGVNLPRITNYAPGTFEARDMAGQDMDPYGQGLLSEGGFRAGMLKSRGKHNAKPRLEDALAVYWGHVNATEHFMAFGEFARDLRAVMNNAEVRAGITSKGGKDLLESAQNWIRAFEQNGLQARSASSRWDEFLRRRQSSQAWLALAYNVGTLMKQSTAALGALLNMGPGAAARQFSRLFAGQLDLGASYRSAVIQRRLDAGYSPEVRQAMAAMMADRPTWASAFLQRGMEAIGTVDAVFTTASHAMAWDYHFTAAKDAGLTDDQARGVADAEAEAVVARTAQPSEMMDRSLFELGLQPTGKFLFMFATEARQKAALALDAYLPSSGLSKSERAMRLFMLHVVFPLAIQTITNLWRDARDDDDDELFDSDNWRGGDYAKAMILGPSNGIPLVGAGLNAALTPLFGGHYFANDPTQPLNKVATGAGDILDAIEEGDLETGIKGARSLLWALALLMGGEKAAGAGAAANAVYDAFRIVDNFTE